MFRQENKSNPSGNVANLADCRDGLAKWVQYGLGHFVGWSASGGHRAGNEAPLAVPWASQPGSQGTGHCQGTGHWSQAPPLYTLNVTLSGQCLK